MSDIFDLAAKPPAIVLSQPRYQQKTFSALVAGPEPDPRPIPIWNLDGIDWLDCERPPGPHEHWAQTVIRLSELEIVYRCPCGADGGQLEPWIDVPDPPWWRRLLRLPRIDLRWALE